MGSVVHKGIPCARCGYRLARAVVNRMKRCFDGFYSTQAPKVLTLTGSASATPLVASSKVDLTKFSGGIREPTRFPSQAGYDQQLLSTRPAVPYRENPDSRPFLAKFSTQISPAETSQCHSIQGASTFIINESVITST
jgi:hypothetical protein